MRVLALTIDGRLTYCTCPPELRGTGRCNHVAHQEDGQNVNDFVASVSHLISDGRLDGPPQYAQIDHDWAVTQMPDNYDTLIEELVGRYGVTKDPDWCEEIKKVPNPFFIGSKEKGTYEEAEVKGVQAPIVQTEDGYAHRLIVTYVFRGKEYTLHWCDIPVVGPDGCVQVNGGKWRFVPVLEQHKAGVVSHRDVVVVKQEGNNVAFSMSKVNNDGMAKIYGIPVPLETMKRFWKTGDQTGLTPGQVWALSHVDPVALERFPDLYENPERLLDLPEDEEGDLSWRRVIDYQAAVRRQMTLQTRRMGVTFRTNLARQVKEVEGGTTLTQDELDERFPLFYVTNLTGNIKRSLTGASNVQTAQNLNPISALTQSQKLSFTGPGGWNKDKAPMSLRMTHPSQKGIIDPLVMSSGKNAGLTVCMTGGEVRDGFVHPMENGERGVSPSDFIPFKLHDDPNRAQMACAHLTQACPIVGGEDPLVSTPAWDLIRGAKLGVNLKVAYTPDKDCYDDAVVISESAAKRMATVQTQPYRCHDPRALRSVKVGQRLERKAMVGNVEIRYGGVVKAVREDGFDVETVFPMTPGDKLSNRHGGKSVVARVRPDREMPLILNETTHQMEPAEVIMTPLGVVGRKNLGQVLECNQGAQMSGLQSDRGGADIEHRTTVVAGGRRVEATSGVEFVMRLNHIAEKKLSGFADELDAERQAAGPRMGEMEALLLSSSKDRLQVLNYMRHQTARESTQRLAHLLKSVGVDMSGVNFDGD